MRRAFSTSSSTLMCCERAWQMRRAASSSRSRWSSRRSCCRRGARRRSPMFPGLGENGFRSFATCASWPPWRAVPTTNPTGGIAYTARLIEVPPPVTTLAVLDIRAQGVVPPVVPTHRIHKGSNGFPGNVYPGPPQRGVELARGIEHPTCGFQNRCSAVELRQRPTAGAIVAYFTTGKSTTARIFREGAVCVIVSLLLGSEREPWSQFVYWEI